MTILEWKEQHKTIREMAEKRGVHIFEIFNDKGKKFRRVSYCIFEAEDKQVDALVEDIIKRSKDVEVYRNVSRGCTHDRICLRYYH